MKVVCIRELMVKEKSEDSKSKVIWLIVGSRDENDEDNDD